jgi:hypothetical protein
MLHRGSNIGAHRGAGQCGKIVLEVRGQQAFNRRPYQIHDGVKIMRLILDRPLQLLQRGCNGAALRVSQYHHQSGAELFGGKLHAADEGRRDNVAGHSNDE